MIMSVRASWTWCTTRLISGRLVRVAPQPMDLTIPEPASALTALHKIGAAFASGVIMRWLTNIRFARREDKT